ncbi:hypothetical protein ACIQUQ_30655 [Streptomyces sp. NPDC101118]|uniref:hypothetical protein n=1 Tax=Streptomyces sp. NPDC101118 TaxID=3366109 RepID=UPI00380D8CE3
MKLNRYSVAGALAGVALLFGAAAPAQAADTPLLSLLDNLNVSDLTETVHLDRVLNPNVVLSNGNVAALQDTADSLLAKPEAKPAAQPMAPAAPAKPATP